MYSLQNRKDWKTGKRDELIILVLHSKLAGTPALTIVSLSWLVSEKREDGKREGILESTIEKRDVFAMMTKDLTFSLS